MNDFIRFSQFLASTFGEQRGRTASRVMGSGVSRLLGGALDEDDATGLAHAGMLVAAVNPKARAPIVWGLGIAFLAGLDQGSRR